METLLGGLFGGVLRLVPELFKFFDAKNERAHELAMVNANIEADKLRSQNHISEIQAEGQVQLDKGGLDALTEAIKGQAAMAVAAGGWAASLSATVRPITTYYLLILYGVAKTSTAIIMYHSGGGDLLHTLQAVYDAEDKAMLAGILNFWFLDRVIKK